MVLHSDRYKFCEDKIIKNHLKSNVVVYQKYIHIFIVHKNVFIENTNKCWKITLST